MSQNLPSHFVYQFANNIQLKLQQKGSKLMPFVMTGNHMGEQASVIDQMSKISMQEVVGRFAPIGRVDAAVDRRWVQPSKFDLNQMIDTFDKLQILADPSSKEVENAVNAAGRQYDDLILDALFGTAKTGKLGTTSTTFPAGQQIAVNYGASANTGLTIAKLRQAKKLLMAAEVDLENDPLCAVVTAAQHDNLLAEIQVISNDYRMGAVIDKGRVTEVLGIQLINCERVDVDGSSYRRVPVFAKSGMYLGKWEEMKTDISQRKDLSGHPWQAYVHMMAGATRLEEEKIIEIKCSEA